MELKVLFFSLQDYNTESKNEMKRPEILPYVNAHTLRTFTLCSHVTHRTHAVFVKQLELH